jgi:hypothetical protein
MTAALVLGLIVVVGLASASRARSITIGYISEDKRDIWCVSDHVSMWPERQSGPYIRACPPCLRYSLARFDKNPANIEHVDSTSAFGWSSGLLDFWTSGFSFVFAFSVLLGMVWRTDHAIPSRIQPSPVLWVRVRVEDRLSIGASLPIYR